ncbi:unnamed protein product, partial [Mesorhabditis belari]|uniref:Uncharacterized protein n=1 Tax=Mesorhabditis belari TaxID=2138241 RepID=A0AAF3EZV2_9BILA
MLWENERTRAPLDYTEPIQVLIDANGFRLTSKQGGDVLFGPGNPKIVHPRSLARNRFFHIELILSRIPHLLVNQFAVATAQQAWNVMLEFDDCVQFYPMMAELGRQQYAENLDCWALMGYVPPSFNTSSIHRS